MSFVIAQPDFVSAAAGQLAGLQSQLGAAAQSAAAPTTGIAVAASDEISAAISNLFGSYGEEFQAVNAQAAAFNSEFVKLLNGGAAAYVEAEIANAQRTLPGIRGVSLGFTAAPTDPLGGLLGGLLGGGTSGGTSGGGLGGLLGGSGGGGLGGLLGGIFGNGTTGFNLGTTGFILPNLPTTLTSLLNPANLTNLPGTLNSALTNLQNLLFPPQPAAAPGTQPYPSPYQTLIDHTSRNLAALSAHNVPFPILNQIFANQSHYAQLAAVDFANYMKGFPGNVPANINLLLNSGNPANFTAGVQQFVNGTAGFYGILGHQLQEIGAGVGQTFPTFQKDFSLAGSSIAAGNYYGAVQYGAKGFIDLFITGFDTSGLGISVDLSNLTAPAIDISGPIGLKGPVAALLPILTALGDQARGTAGTFPANSWAGATMQDFANGVGTLTDASVTANFAVTLNLLNPGASGIGGEAMFGVPLQLGFAALGSPFAGLGGLAVGSKAFGDALVTGNLLGAANAVGNMPAYVLDGFLNGEVIIDTPLPVTVTVGVAPLLLPITIPTVAQLPMSGLLVDPHPITATVPLSQILPLPGLPNLVITLGGTKFGGFLPFLVNSLPQDLAKAMAYGNHG